MTVISSFFDLSGKRDEHGRARLFDILDPARTYLESRPERVGLRIAHSAITALMAPAPICIPHLATAIGIVDIFHRI
jgi:hypothetical protein